MRTSSVEACGLGRPAGARRCSWRGRCDERGAADLHSRRQHQLANLLPGAPPPCGPLVTRPLVSRDGPCLAGRPACAPIPCVRLPRHVRADAHQRAPPLSLTSRRLLGTHPALATTIPAPSHGLTLTLTLTLTLCCVSSPRRSRRARAPDEAAVLPAALAALIAVAAVAVASRAAAAAVAGQAAVAATSEVCAAPQAPHCRRPTAPPPLWSPPLPPPPLPSHSATPVRAQAWAL